MLAAGYAYANDIMAMPTAIANPSPTTNNMSRTNKNRGDLSNSTAFWCGVRRLN
ncbi:hypothetical protein HCG51_07580 [Tolypothrix sp. PCC 7910]|uniref:hypothetical protein n=1 Tax=Tolypothrix sp. PCC 7910 TaxID=2099387 RepID=UPI00142771C5|nr:hypothetical protein [Tolypothrix sp. PCC 7910]QIR36627.1 hypothetical protein HCG51_07580 [Tolypothrix sp. PCC 7910]